MNFWDILILLAVLAGVVLAVRRVRKTRASGGCTCGCGCSGSCAGCSRPCGAKKN